MQATKSLSSLVLQAILSTNSNSAEQHSQSNRLLPTCCFSSGSPLFLLCEHMTQNFQRLEHPPPSCIPFQSKKNMCDRLSRLVLFSLCLLLWSCIGDCAFLWTAWFIYIQNPCFPATQRQKKKIKNMGIWEVIGTACLSQCNHRK